MENINHQTRTDFKLAYESIPLSEYKAESDYDYPSSEYAKFFDDMINTCRDATGYDASKITITEDTVISCCPYADWPADILNKRFNANVSDSSVRCAMCRKKTAWELRDKMTKYMK